MQPSIVVLGLELKEFLDIGLRQDQKRFVPEYLNHALRNMFRRDRHEVQELMNWVFHVQKIGGDASGAKASDVEATIAIMNGKPFGKGNRTMLGYGLGG